MSLLSTIRSAAAGLRAASLGIQVTSHNVANVETEGYTRKRVVQTASNPVEVSGIWLGIGPSLDGVERIADQFLGMQRTTATGEDAASTALYEAMSILESTFSEETTNTLPDLVGAFYDSLANLTSDPASLPYRSEAIVAGRSLSNAVNATADSLSDAMINVDAEIKEIISTQVNPLLQQLADLNALAEATHSTERTGATDILDARDAVVSQLAELIGTTVEYVGDGTVNLFVGGHAIVSGNNARTISVETNATTGALKIRMSVDSGFINITDELGGRAGGLNETHVYATDWLSQLDTFVETFSDEFNTQHALGFDQSGAAGGDFFLYTSGNGAETFAIDESFIDDPTLFALSASATGGVGDQDNLTLLIALQDNSTFGTNGETAHGYLSSLYASVGREVASAAATAERDSVTLGDLNALQTSLSGVSLDEEATSLIAYQAAYQASARVLTAANEMLGVLMDMAR